jgi:hypothetical protein
VERDVAAAAALEALAQAIAAGLNHVAARLVAAEAGNAATVFGVLTFANTATQIALANRGAVESAAATAQTVAEHPAEILQRAAGDFVVARTVQLQAAGALFDAHCASR